MKSVDYESLRRELYRLNELRKKRYGGVDMKSKKDTYNIYAEDVTIRFKGVTRIDVKKESPVYFEPYFGDPRPTVAQLGGSLVSIECDDYIINPTGNFNSSIPKIKKVIFSGPVTTVLWKDGTKTHVRCENEEFDKEKGLAMCIAKKALGNKGRYYDEFKKWIEETD